MTILRCFLAVELPSALQEAIHSATAATRRVLGSQIVRWIPEENIHLTLKFLGETAPSSLEQIEAAMRSEVAQFRPFGVELVGMGAFPTTKRARVIWIGLQAPTSLASLQRELDVATSRLGYVSEERPFSPHLTVGRVRQNVSNAELQQIRDALEGAAVGPVGELTVEAVHLYRSELLPSGSVYSQLYSVKLSGA